MMALIVPYRNRQEHLNTFIPHMENFLKTIPHTIFIIEQSSELSFNRGKLLNIGFNLACKTVDYVCFHDVDMLPIKADYSYPKNPTHLATHVEQFDFDMPYPSYFGGVTLFNTEDFKKINGYSNRYFGWGAEDDDLYTRCKYADLTVKSREGYFSSLPHEKVANDHPEVLVNQEILEELLYGASKIPEEGLKTLEYEIQDQKTENNVVFYLVKI